MSKTATMTLAEFLRARYDEAESRARGHWRVRQDSGVETVEGDDLDLTMVRVNGSRMSLAAFRADYGEQVKPDAFVLADLEAKRQIIDECSPAIHEWEKYDTWESAGFNHSGAKQLAEWVLSNLALPYVDHPDYREEWRP